MFSPGKNKSNPNWDIGDLLTVIKEHTVFRASLDNDGEDCILRNSDGYPMHQIELEMSTIVMALDPRPRPGNLALIRVIHDGNVWAINSNYVKRCER